MNRARSRFLPLVGALSLVSACAQTTVQRSVRNDGAPVLAEPSSASTETEPRPEDVAYPTWARASGPDTEFDSERGTLKVEGIVLPQGEEAIAAGEEDATGTDPRGFSTKFMPYFRYSHLDNGLDEYQMTVFGLVRFSDTVAFTYEVPVAMERDFSDVSEFGSSNPGAPNGLPASDDVAGMGDSNIRMFQKLGKWAGMDWMAGFQLTFPTGSEEALSSKKFQAGPMLVNVVDITKLHAFFAMMHIYQQDVFGDGDRDDIQMYIGRWFYMQPLSKPGPGIGDGWYLLPEFQPVYDFENSEFSLWIGPEVGKIVKPGRVLYVKPGFGVDADEGGERETTFEFGLRWFF